MGDDAKVFEIRASSLPMALACPGSVRRQDGEVLVDPVSEAADNGSAGHDVMRVIVDGDASHLGEVDLQAIARKWSVDVDELRILAFIGLKVWLAARDWLRPAQAEVSLEGTFDLGGGLVLKLTGHIDALTVAQTRAAHGDWKFGRLDRDYGHQVNGYSALIFANYPDVENVDGFLGWMRAGEAERVSMARGALWEWLDEVKRRVVDWDGVFHPGDHCGFCPRSQSCPARAAQARHSILTFGGADMAERVSAGLAGLTEAEVADVFRKWKAIKRLGDDLEGAVKERVRAAGGRLRDGKGWELRFVPSPRRVLNPKLALPVLRERLTEDELNACIVVRPSAVDDAVANKAERGGKKKAIEAIRADLDEAGAVTEETTERLMDLRVKE